MLVAKYGFLQASVLKSDTIFACTMLDCGKDVSARIFGLAVRSSLLRCQFCSGLF
jgi:hypothetical protein